ncbi:MAG: DUF5009 domain-containing protein [Symploca sp. SIO3E6]|nr:DUF5009 domain-containing protein [Caldora sp. SIO3E6]
MPNLVNSTSKPPTKRAVALDALRGFAILTMVLSGVVPRKILPAWMYHAQLPPPTHTFNPNLPGLTWVDLVFPLFLFSMGAAIPLALSRRLDQGWSQKKIILSILKRGFLLGSFAIFLQHIRPFTIHQSPNPQTWRLAMLGFVVLFLMFVRWPKFWNSRLKNSLTIAAWGLGIGLIYKLGDPDGTGFSLEQSDIILVILTNIAVFSSIIWLFTRHYPWLRLGLLGLLLALNLSANTDGWIATVWSVSPVPWIFRFDYLKYLLIGIPGTLVGDLIYSWLQSIDAEMRGGGDAETRGRGDAEILNLMDAGEENFSNTLPNQKLVSYPWQTNRFLGIIGLMLLLIVVLLIGLQARLVWQTTLLSIILCISGFILFSKPVNVTEKLLNTLYRWGVYWLSLGLFFEPYQGGIKKDDATISYFFTTTGMAIFILILFIIIIDVFQKQSWLQLLIDNGMNPMIAYVAFANVLWPILILTEWNDQIIQMTSTPITGFFRGLVYTLIVAVFVSLFTRFKLFLKT